MIPGSVNSPSMMSLKEDAIFLTLVHGTFSPFATWTMPDSNFSRMLRTSILEAYRITGCPSPTIVVSRVRWSGWNGLRARRNASHRLSEKLAEDVKQYPDSRHFVVSHSHGGNIAMYALRDPELASRISGIVCMATPFLRVHLRDSDSGVFAIHAAIVLTLTWLGIFTFPIYIDVPVLIKAAVGILLAPLILNLFFKTWQNNARYWVKEMQFPSLRRNQMLVLKVHGDEAADGLKSAHIVFDLLFRLFQVLGLPDKFLRNKLGSAYFRHSRIYPLGVAMTMLLVLNVSPLIVLLTVGIIYIASFIATGGWCLPHLPLDISAEQDPPVSRDVYSFESFDWPSGREDIGPFSLQHSKIYDHPDLFPKIAEWIKSKQP